jgi:hypothetical protein
MEWSLAQGRVAENAHAFLQSNERFSDLLPAGWSADGNSLRVWARATGGGAGFAGPTVLVEVPLGDAPLRVLARGSGDSSIAPPSSSGSWSPDGLWAASARNNGVTIADKLGYVQYTLREGDGCSGVAWNPAADLSALSRPVDVALVSATNGWQFENARVRHDPSTQSVHAWGEIVNRTGESKRIVAFVPVLQDGIGIVNVEQPDYVFGQRGLFSSADLAADATLPFGMTFTLPQGTRLQKHARIVVHVTAELGEPTSDDLRIAFNEFDLNWPKTLRVSGEYEHPGRGYDEYVAIIVTAFGLDGQLMGWNWQHMTGPVDRSPGRHPFGVTIEFSPHIVDLNLDISYYKIQIFGR